MKISLMLAAQLLALSAVQAQAREPTAEELYPPSPQAQPAGAITRCLTVVHVQFYDYADHAASGDLVVNRDLAPDVAHVFELIRRIHFPVKSATPVNQFGWSDDDSMDADNSSSYNYRPITGGGSLSYHAIGRAVDINTRCNPYVKNGEATPPGSEHNPLLPCALDGEKGRQVIAAFKALGWSWGGSWTSPKDYQHFEKPGINGKSAPYCE